jgi:hypothetical protein
MFEVVGDMQSQTEHPVPVYIPGFDADGRGLLLEEVNFKWLLAGFGWWIDMSRFHSEASYATRFLELAKTSDCIALRDSAVFLQRQKDISSNSFETTMGACLPTSPHFNPEKADQHVDYPNMLTHDKLLNHISWRTA